MSTKTPAAQESSGDRLFDALLADHVLLGRDAEGYVHHLDRQTATVHRIHPTTGARERRTDLTARPERPPRALEVYIRFVAEGTGWADRRKYTAADLFGGVGR
jgi:hypothetical protein